ncbi:hypothetical protein O181_022182 [Austropuccinia psidii MF-1]|uniref:Uncharacterized protein n=1 Tax=Austropuccinia psidii MF-1 TaxID=1389203 RepID=A0A9Q3CF00_9BASI|nr:hypothetical protein [Austropuccinia psidii MF-1]
MKRKQCLWNFNPSPSKCTYCFFGKAPCPHPTVPLSTIERCSWRKKDGPFGKEFPVPEAPTPDDTLGYSSFPCSVPPPKPISHTSRTILASPMKPSLIPKSRPSPVLTSHQSQPVACTSQRRDNWSPLPFPAAQVFQRLKCWAIKVTREDPTVVNGGQDAVTLWLRRADRHSREIILYAKNGIIPGTASEEMPSKYSWYEVELMNELQRTFDDLGKDK